MDVTCNRCGTSYEFEEGLVSSTGTTVKCTQCGHLFKVHRASSEAPTAVAAAPSASEAAPPGSRWRVRRTDGSLHTLASLAELTSLIAAGQFRRDDELSRTGQVWKRLGEIHELANLFEGGAHGSRTTDPPAPPGLPPPPTASERRGLEPRTTAPPPRPRRTSPPERVDTPRGFEVMGSAVELETRVPDAAHSSPASAAVAPSVARPATGPATGSPAARPPSVSPPTRAPTFAPQPAHELAQAFEAGPSPPRSRLWLWVVLVSAAVAGAGGAVTQVLVRLEQPTSAAPAITILVAQADAALAAYRDTRFEEAIALYRKALPSAPDDAHLLSSLSRAYAQYSQSMRTRAEIRAMLRAPLGLQQTDVEDPEVERLAHEAKLYGQRAAQRNPGNEEAGVALSDALRLAGNLVAARAEIDRVRATQRVPEAERLRVEALLAIDEAHGRVSAGRRLAAMAVAHDPRSIAARLLLARCLAHDGDLTGSAAQLSELRELDPTLPALAEHDAELAALRSKPVSTAAAPRPSTTSGQAKAPLPSVQPGHPSEPPASPSKTSAAGDDDDPSPGPSFAAASDLARKGERLLESGSVSAAKDAFDEALTRVPNLPRARTGLGYVHLERGQVNAALGQFKGAAAAGYPDAMIGLGDTYRRLGRLDEALRTYKSYLKRFPQGARRSIAEHQVELLQEQVGATPPSP